MWCGRLCGGMVVCGGNGMGGYVAHVVCMSADIKTAFVYTYTRHSEIIHMQQTHTHIMYTYTHTHDVHMYTQSMYTQSMYTYTHSPCALISPPPLPPTRTSYTHIHTPSPYISPYTGVGFHSHACLGCQSASPHCDHQGHPGVQPSQGWVG